MTTFEQIEQNRIKDEKIIGIFRTIHSKVIAINIDLSGFTNYEKVHSDKKTLEKFYSVMKQIYNEIHSELMSFEQTKPLADQKEIFDKIIIALKDIEIRIQKYEKYMLDMSNSLNEPIDKKTFEKDFHALTEIYNILKEDEEIADKYMKILENSIVKK